MSAAPERSTPTSFIAVTTSGWTRGPGSVPAEIARALVGSDNRLNHAAAICDRPALWTHAKSTVFMMRTFQIEASTTRSADRGSDGTSHRKQERRGRRAGKLRDDESRHVSRTNASERIRQRASERDGRVRKRRRRGKPVRRGDVRGDSKRNGIRPAPRTSPDHRHKTEGRDELADQLRRTAPRVERQHEQRSPNITCAVHTPSTAPITCAAT